MQRLSTALPSAARSTTLISQRSASKATDHLEKFREINRLAAQGKWDAINNSPKMFMFGTAQKEANALYAKIIQPEDSFSKYGGQPYGPIIFLFSRVAGFFAGLYVLCKTYEFVVPEKYRLHYKYAPKHHHDDHH